MNETKDQAESGLRQVALAGRGIIALEGPDARDFLQGIVSNDVTKASPQQALWAAFLTPQGKYLYDFFLLEHEGRLLLESEAARLPEFLRRLKLYRLRSKVELSDVSADWRVSAVWGEGAAERFALPTRAGAVRTLENDAGLLMVDPRFQGLGLRLWSKTEDLLPGVEPGALADYEALRITLGLPDGSRDMEVDKAILLENGFDELAGVDWKKGCYMGQELTARTKYRGLVKKRLLPVESASEIQDSGVEVLQGDKVVGELRSRSGRHALALLRLQALAGGEALTVNGIPVSVTLPDWVVLPQAKEAAS